MPRSAALADLRLRAGRGRLWRACELAVKASWILVACGCGAASPPSDAAAGDSTGGGGPASANAGAGGALTAMWTKNANKYGLSFGTTFLEIDPENGARITALRIGGSTGTDLIADASVTGQEDNFGSTFWPSPQNWSWPPTDANSIGAINSQPYAASLEADTLTLRSALNASPPTLSVTKKIWADTTKNAIVIEYTMSNGGSDSVTVAPWEITRVPPGGITFYAAAGPPVAHGLPLPVTRELVGATWYAHDPSDATFYKLFADGRGWIAHGAADLLLIKSFPDISAEQSPAGEAEIEIYAAPRYVEVEQQGALETLAPGQSLHWTVRWYARKLDAPVTIGNADLVAYVLNQIK